MKGPRLSNKVILIAVSTFVALVALVIAFGPPSVLADDGEIGRTQGTSLKSTICALPDIILGEGLCGPVMIFIPTITIVVVLFAFGVVNPIILAGAGFVVFTGMSVLMLPGPVMIAGFVIASLGTTAALILFKK